MITEHRLRELALEEKKPSCPNCYKRIHQYLICPNCGYRNGSGHQVVDHIRTPERKK